MPLPWPAPDWINTLCPSRVSSSTPTGIMATRYSSVLISLGTPTTYLRGGAMSLPFCSERKRNRSLIFCGAVLGNQEQTPTTILNADFQFSLEDTMKHL